VRGVCQYPWCFKPTRGSAESALVSTVVLAVWASNPRGVRLKVTTVDRRSSANASFKPTRGSAESGLRRPTCDHSVRASNPRGVRLKVGAVIGADSGGHASNPRGVRLKGYQPDPQPDRSHRFKPTRGSAERARVSIMAVRFILLQTHEGFG